MSEINEFGQEVGAALSGWAPRPRPSHDPMSGRFCRVEKFVSVRHGPGFVEAFMHAVDDGGWTYLPDDRPQSEAEFQALCGRLEASMDPLHHAIIERASGQVVGCAAFMRVDPPNGVTEVGAIRFSAKLQRTAAGTEAVYLMMRRAFDELGYRRLEWKCDVLNTPSRRAAERYGFTFEGVFRQALVVKGRNRDTAWYSIIDKDWPAICTALVAWLSENNFDAAGLQVRSLASFRGL